MSPLKINKWYSTTLTLPSDSIPTENRWSEPAVDRAVGVSGERNFRHVMNGGGLPIATQSRVIFPSK